MTALKAKEPLPRPPARPAPAKVPPAYPGTAILGVFALVIGTVVLIVACFGDERGDAGLLLGLTACLWLGLGAVLLLARRVTTRLDDILAVLQAGLLRPPPPPPSN